MLKLYDYVRSSACFRVRMALNYKQLDHTKVKINLLESQQLTPGYTELNPSALVPAFITSDGQILRQSLAILEYLEEEYPTRPLLPKAAVDRAYVRALALDVACDIHPLNNLRVLKYLKSELGHSESDARMWYQHWIACGLISMEKSISSNGFYIGKYCYKDQFTFADACLLPQLYNAKRFNCPLDAYPTLLAIEAECLKHDFVLSAYPERQ